MSTRVRQIARAGDAGEPFYSSKDVTLPQTEIQWQPPSSTDSTANPVQQASIKGRRRPASARPRPGRAKRRSVTRPRCKKLSTNRTSAKTADDLCPDVFLEVRIQHAQPSESVEVNVIVVTARQNKVFVGAAFEACDRRAHQNRA